MTRSATSGSHTIAATAATGEDHPADEASHSAVQRCAGPHRMPATGTVMEPSPRPAS